MKGRDAEGGNDVSYNWPVGGWQTHRCVLGPGGGGLRCDTMSSDHNQSVDNMDTDLQGGFISFILM